MIPAHAAKELHRSKPWASYWLDRYKKEGIGGLKDRPRSGRPTEVPEQVMLKIRKQLSENPSGWQAKQVMDIIYKKTGVRYHEVHVYRLLHKWGFSSKVPQNKRFVNTASEEEKEVFKKRRRKS
ncbi:MAG TPA: helix-turn-helix domain-containing protein [Nitrososphaera sp.]|nr:helix-turn-helix domain-containing protein [Nitrososphaera sp.]